jgi:hypothetical protein
MVIESASLSVLDTSRCVGQCAHMSAPILRALMDSGTVWDDPSEDLLFELLSDVQRGDETYFIVEQLADESGQTFIQVMHDGQHWIVERREGGADQHFRIALTHLRQAHEALTTWSFGLPLVPAAGAWTNAAT